MKVETFVAKTNEDVNWIFSRLRENEVIACDVETDWFDWRRTKLLSIGFSWKEGTGVSIPLLHKESKLTVDINELRDILESKKLIFQNAQFDLKQLWKYGISANVYFDTMLAHYVGFDERQGTHGLKQLAKRYLDYEYLDIHNIVNVRKRTFEHIPLEHLLKYNANDAAVTFMLYKLFKDKVPEMFYYLMMPAVTTLTKMEFRGIKINRDYLLSMKKPMTKEAEKLESKIKSKYKFDPGSPKKTLMYFQSLGFDVKNVGAYQMLKISRKNNAAKLVYKYRKIKKLLSTYTDKLLERLDENKYIHTEYLLHGTITGRLASRNPSLHTIPRASKIKRIFIPSEGYLFLEADYKQAEMRIAAILANDENLLRMFKEERDIHHEMAKRIFNKDEISEEERSLAKTINYGFIYGRGPGSVSIVANVSYQDAKRMFNIFYSLYPAVRRFMNKCRTEAKTKRKLTTLTGRTRRYRDEDPERKFSTSANFPIASLQSDICLSSLCKIDKLLSQSNFNSRPVLTVHDSVLLEVPEYELSMVSRMVKKVMEEMPGKYIKDCPLKFPVDITVGKNWGDLKQYIFDIDYTDENQLKLFHRRAI